MKKQTVRELIALIEEASSWNKQDLENMEDITPDESMLRARARVLREARALARKLAS